MSPERLWHYTKGTKLRAILADGKILRARANVQKPERPAVWLSTHPHWEPTVTAKRQNPDGTLQTATLAQMVRLVAHAVSVTRGAVDMCVTSHP